MHFCCLQIEPVNISPDSEGEKSEDDLINDFKSQDSGNDAKVSMKDIKESPEAASANKKDGVCSKGKYEVCVESSRCTETNRLIILK